MKILLVDDHVLLREALRGALKELESEAAIFEASDGRETMQFVERHPDVDLVLLDLNLPDRDGFSVLADLRKCYPSISVVVISGHQHRDNVVRALDLGALGFIPKSASRKVILSALQLVFSGGIYIPPQALSRLEPPPATPQPSAPGGARISRPGQPAVSPADLGLTERQVDVLALMMHGKSNKAICRVLNLAEPTVKNHVRAILKALKVTNRTEAVIAVGALQWELPLKTGISSISLSVRALNR
jgi:DNA-binding NarL/FixJ family response regulator